MALSYTTGTRTSVRNNSDNDNPFASSEKVKMRTFNLLAVLWTAVNKILLPSHSLESIFKSVFWDRTRVREHFREENSWRCYLWSIFITFLLLISNKSPLSARWSRLRELQGFWINEDRYSQTETGLLLWSLFLTSCLLLISSLSTNFLLASRTGPRMREKSFVSMFTGGNKFDQRREERLQS